MAGCAYVGVGPSFALGSTGPDGRRLQPAGAPGRRPRPARSGRLLARPRRRPRARAPTSSIAPVPPANAHQPSAPASVELGRGFGQRREHRRLPAVPGRQPVAAQRLGRSARSAFGRLGRQHRREHASAPRLRQRSELRHPLRRRAGVQARCRSRSPPTATKATPAPTRCRSTRRSRPAATRTCSSRRPTATLRALQRETDGRGLVGRFRCCVQPQLRRAASGRLDVGRCGRLADPARTGAARRGRVRPYRPRACASRFRSRSTGSFTRRRIRPARPPTRMCHPWARAFG